VTDHIDDAAPADDGNETDFQMERGIARSAIAMKPWGSGSVSLFEHFSLELPIQCSPQTLHCMEYQFRCTKYEINGPDFTASEFRRWLDLIDDMPDDEQEGIKKLLFLLGGGSPTQQAVSLARDAMYYALNSELPFYKDTEADRKRSIFWGKSAALLLSARYEYCVKKNAESRKFETFYVDDHIDDLQFIYELLHLARATFRKKGSQMKNLSMQYVSSFFLLDSPGNARGIAAHALEDLVFRFAKKKSKQNNHLPSD
jgi:hypothetical protein